VPLRRVLIGVVVVVIAAATGLALTLPWDEADSGAGEAAVQQATLRPGEISLVLSNESEDPARVAQIILNDAFVDFHQTQSEVKPGAAEQITIAYPWISGENYDVRLMTASGATVEYEIEEAHAGIQQA
jgi:zinc transporter, ZIP family